MGVKLKSIIESRTLDFKDLAGKIIAIDAPNIIFSLFSFSYQNYQHFFSNLMIDRTQRAISHLYGLLYRVNFYYLKRAFPIFCFDGIDSDLKRVVSKDQLNDFRFTKKRYEEAIKNDNEDLARKIATNKEFLWPNILKESKELLGALGVPILESPASAEAQCAQLVKKNLADFTISQDYDSLLFGSPRTIQNLSKSLKRKVKGNWHYNKVVPLYIDLKHNLKRLGIDQFKLVDMGILVGNDYFSGIKGIGPKKALKLIREHGNIETIACRESNNYDFILLDSIVLKQVRKIFLLPEVLESPPGFFWNPPNEIRATHLMCEDHHLSKKRVENNLSKLESNYWKCKDFFTKQKFQSIQKSRQTTLDGLF